MILTLAAAAAVWSLGAQEQQRPERPEMPKDAVVNTTFKTQQEAETALAQLLTEKGFEVKEGERFAAFAPKPDFQPKEAPKDAPKEGEFAEGNPGPKDGHRGHRGPGRRGHRHGHGHGPGHGFGPGHGPMQPGVFADFQVENETVTVTLSGMGVDLKEIAEALPNNGHSFVEHKRPEKPERPEKNLAIP